jgi:hypothetical protein
VVIFRATKFLMKCAVLVALFTLSATHTLYGAESSKDYVDWPIAEGTSDRTPALQPRADQSSIQFQSTTGFEVGIMGSDPGKSQDYQCTSPFDKKCKEERVARFTSQVGQRWNSLNQLPICLSARDSTPCIRGILISEVGGKKYSLSDAGTVPGYAWPANQTYGSPAGALTHIWRGEGDSENSGYVLNAKINVRGSYNSDKTEILDFTTSLFRYELNPLSDPYVKANQRTFCLWVDNSGVEPRCARQKFLDQTSLVTVIYHLPKSLTGWFAGRMSDATLNVESIDTDFNAVTVSSYPAEVPVFAATIPCVKGWVPCGTGITLGFTGIPIQEYIQSLQSILKDKATLEIPSWGLRSTNKLAYEGCKVPEKGFAGLIFSNATFVYSYPPKFEYEILRYEMGALHLESDGSVFKGNFDMFIESGFARCLWKLSKAPVQASIDVISKDGIQSIATTSLGEKNGFIRMRAAGFTFSTSTVLMKLQNKESGTIQCVRKNNKKTINVTGYKCPKGTIKVPR